jgi:hypothetical protein
MKKCLPVLILVASGALRAQSGELWLFSGGASILANGNIGSPFSDGQTSDVQLGNGFRLGFRFDFNSAGHLGHEIQYGYNRTNFVDNTGQIRPDNSNNGMGIHQGGYNLLYYLHAAKKESKEESKVRPFATAGFHLSDFVLPGSGGPQGGSVKPGGNVGAGVKIRLSPLFGFRVDVREYITAKPNWNSLLFNQGGPLYQTEISAGFGVYF